MIDRHLMHFAITRVAALCCTALLPIAASGAQEDSKAAQWPKLEGDAGARLHRAQQALPKLAADDEAGFDKLSAEIASIGAAATPRLLKDLAKAGSGEDEVLIARLRTILEQISSEPQWAPLFALELKNASSQVRFVSAERLLAAADPKTLAAVQAQFLKEKDIFVRNTLTLVRCTLGDPEALPDLEQLLRTEWPRWREQAHRALRGLRNNEATREAAMKTLRTASEEKDRLFALRILAGVGDKSAIDTIAPLLDADSRAIREAAVNALRSIVDQQDPTYDIPVFDLIQHISDWKKRLPGIKR